MLYTPIAGALTSPAIDAVLTMCPSYSGSFSAAASISGVKMRMPWMTLRRLTPSTHSQSCSLFSQISPPAPTPALLNSRWTVPNAARAASASA
ncbi:hypothetical protein D9M70_651820 [compost metagenome]